MRVYQNTSIGPLLTLTKSKTTLRDANYYLLLTQRSMYLAAYRQLFRLRHLVGSDRNLSTYQNVIRRKFQKVDFQMRRSQVLRIEESLTNEQMAHRLANTIAFVFNSTCNKTDDSPPVQYYEDVKKASEPRTETSVILTILLMDHQAPHEIKYDFSYKWVGDTKAFYRNLHESKLNRKEMNRLFNTGRASHLGFLHYEESLMALNECLLLCL